MFSTVLWLQLKQKDVAELLAQADDLANQNKTYQEVYAAMAESLGEAWRDLNKQLEYRKMLLDQSIAFHESAQQVGAQNSCVCVCVCVCVCKYNFIYPFIYSHCKNVTVYF